VFIQTAVFRFVRRRPPRSHFCTNLAPTSPPSVISRKTVRFFETFEVNVPARRNEQNVPSYERNARFYPDVVQRRREMFVRYSEKPKPVAVSRLDDIIVYTAATPAR